MRRETAIQVVIIRDFNDPFTKEYVNLIKQIFKGVLQERGQKNLYFTERMGINVPLLDPRIIDSVPYRRALLGAAKTTIAIEIRSRGHQGWPDAVNKLLNKREQVRRIAVDIPAPVADDTIQLSATEKGNVEPSFIPVASALATLEKCRVELIKKVYGPQQSKKSSKLFISHAKVDGMAMSHAIVSLLNRIKSMPHMGDLFHYFYDAESIQPGGKWREVLEGSAKNCLFLALRTEEYESRYWCRQEFLWAERKLMPMMVVDLRREMYCAASSLPLDNVASARISDGNIIRVLFHALRCHIEYLQLQFRVNPQPCEVVLPRYPSSVSIEGALDKIASKPGSRAIIYAGKTLPEERTSAIRQQLKANKVSVMSESEWEMNHV